MPTQILLVDDDPDNLDVLELLLKEQYENAIELIRANSGLEALKIYDQYDFRVVITDWDMPDGGGKHLIEQLRGRGKSVPIILWSAGENLDYSFVNNLNVQFVFSKLRDAESLLNVVGLIVKR